MEICVNVRVNPLITSTFVFTCERGYTTYLSIIIPELKTMHLKKSSFKPMFLTFQFI